MKKKYVRQKINRLFFSCSLVFLLFFSLTIPLEFAKAVGSPSFWTSRYYVTGLIEDGSLGAGLKGRLYEYASLPTSVIGV